MLLTREIFLFLLILPKKKGCNKHLLHAAAQTLPEADAAE